MRKNLHSLFTTCLAGGFAMVAPAREAFSQALRITDTQVETRAAALHAADAFKADGFRTRDCHWWGSLSRNEPKIVEINLFAGNEYRFVAATSPEAAGVTLAIYDEKGHPVPTHAYGLSTQAAVGFVPTVSGPYYIHVGMENPSEDLRDSGNSGDSGECATFCLLYSYK